LGEVIIPPRYVEVSGPLIFLAGPIRGTADWQSEAIRILKSNNASLSIASPRRQELMQHDFPESTFNEQVDWEHFYLQQSAKNGVILFWLAKELEHRCDRAYGQTTRFELGEAVAMHHFIGTQVVVGIEDGFTGARYLQKTLSKKYPDIPVCNDLKKACELSVRLAIEKIKWCSNSTTFLFLADLIIYYVLRL